MAAEASAGLSDRSWRSPSTSPRSGMPCTRRSGPPRLLPDQASADDPFVMALRRIEFESGRTIQAQIIFLKGQDLLPHREAVSAAVESRHAQVRKLWTELLAGLGVNETTAA